jgi:hypothetical protein
MRALPHARPLLLSLALVLAPAIARAQEEADGRLAVHGYITQGYGAADGARFYGLRSQGSSDFRLAALQVRYDRERDGLLIQLNNRRLGESKIPDFESSVNVNWAFYERRSASGGTALKVGRIPVPRGIYNELRNVGVVLPMYRAPIIFYDEGAYFSETIDGGVLQHGFRDGQAWSVDASVYAGGWSLLAYDQSGDEFSIGRVRADNAVGAQLWLNTPIDGVRIGGAAQRYKWKGIDEEGAIAARQDVWEVQGSVDATFGRAFVRGETLLQNYETDDYYANYVQLGAAITPRLWLVGLGEYAYERNWELTSETYPADFDWHKAAGVAVNYRVTPQFVVKAEHHWNKGIQVEQPASPLDPPRFRYFILSASASF